MVDVTELALVVVSLKLLDGTVVTVANADSKALVLLLCFLCHLAGESVINGNGLLAEDVLACLESIHGNNVVSVVGGEDVYHVNLGVLQSNLVVGDNVLDLGEVRLCGYCLLLDDIAGVLDPYFVDLCERGKVCVSCNSSASDDSNYCGFHICPPKINNFFQK